MSSQLHFLKFMQSLRKIFHHLPYQIYTCRLTLHTVIIHLTISLVVSTGVVDYTYFPLFFLSSMVSLEDKILGYVRDNYCSSSESDDEAGDDDDKGCIASNPTVSTSTELPPRTAETSNGGSSVNTGPKGVLEDWRLYKQMKCKEDLERDKKLVEAAKRLCIIQQPVEDEDKVFAELENDNDLLKQFAQKRMKELGQKYGHQNSASYGQVFELNHREDMLNAVDVDSAVTTIFVHIYENEAQGCAAMDECFQALAESYPQFKFCRLRASAVGMSREFRKAGLPTLQAYKNKDLVLNFVRIIDYLGDEFEAEDVERFLIEYGGLPDSQ
ncbi:Phosducin-like protein [Trichinella zimbabwensis]|uniref:Phosducin-like protein n=1 Tax=Trichinella zimbabwensis TaxID=268475 RepID=A0A0V1HEF4_9BILA|nr:Phosducin-like protein [Trichinella zimbabwensis]